MVLRKTPNTRAATQSLLVCLVAILLLGTFTSVTLAQLDCDLNSDDVCNVDDIDDLTRAIALNSVDPLYDLNTDGAVNTADRDFWLQSGALQNGFAEPYNTGDADLDGNVNASDLNALGLNWQQTDKVWSQGDFYPDGMVNASDLMFLGINWQKTIPRAVITVPEPMSCMLLVLGGWLLFHWGRRASRRSMVVPLVLCGLAEAALAQPFCDLDGDGACDIVDIDDLSRAITSGMPHDPKYDLNVDGILDPGDVDEWLDDGASHNGFGAPYLRGDSNLDGAVNVTDLNALGLHWRQNGAVWSQGDFSTDGLVSSADLMLVGLNWQQRIPLAAAAVPEPMSVLMRFVGAIVVLQLAPRYRSVLRKDAR